MSVLDKPLLAITSSASWKQTADDVEKILFSLLSFIGIVRFNTDIEKAATGRSKLIWQEAHKRSIPMEQVVIFGKYIDYYHADIRGGKFYFQSLPIPPWLPQQGYSWIDDKFVLSEKLRSQGIPSPITKKIKTLKEAEAIFKLSTKPVIIKPKFGSRGRHTTTNINTIGELKDAFDLAHEITTSMVIQEHLFGSVYRATVINNKLVGFFRADSPKITGDGLKTVRELVKGKNLTRNERVSEIIINDDLINFLGRQNYTLDNVLEKGKTVDLSAKTGRMYGSYTEEMLGKVHPKMHEIFRKAGQVAEIPVAGFDLIIPDPTLDPDTQRWGIIECNSLPFIDLHYFALEGPQINLAENIWDLWN